MGYRDCLIYQAVRHFSTARGTLVERRLYGGYVFSCRKLPGCSGARKPIHRRRAFVFRESRIFCRGRTIRCRGVGTFPRTKPSGTFRMTMSMSSPASASVPSRTQLMLVLAACSACYCVANATWWMQPVLIDQLVAVRGLTASAAGLIVTAEMVAMSATSFVLAKVLKGGRFLTLGAAGTLFAIAASFISLRVSANFPPLLITRVLVGLGEGFPFMVANTALVCFADRDRAFARMSLVNVLFGVALVGLAPMVSGHDGARNALTALLLSLCVLLPVVFLMPSSYTPAEENPAQENSLAHVPLKSQVGLRVALLSFATFIVALGSGIMWCFYGLIGSHTGLSSPAVNSTITASILSAIAGTLAAALLGKSFGRLIPVSIAVVLTTCAVIALSRHPGPWAFRIGACMNAATIYFMTPYLFAAGSVQDASGRGATFVGGAFLLSGAVSPYFGGVLLDSVGMEVVGILVVFTSILAWAAFAYVERRSQAPRALEPAC